MLAEAVNQVPAVPAVQKIQGRRGKIRYALHHWATNQVQRKVHYIFPCLPFQVSNLAYS